jgi:hypothetical protein
MSNQKKPEPIITLKDLQTLGTSLCFISVST